MDWDNIISKGLVIFCLIFLLAIMIKFWQITLVAIGIMAIITFLGIIADIVEKLVQ